MKLNKLIAGTLITAGLALEAWTLREIINVKVQVAVLTSRVESLAQSHIVRK